MYERKYSSCQQSVKITSVKKDFVLSMNVQTLVKYPQKKTENNWKKPLFNERTHLLSGIQNCISNLYFLRKITVAKISVTNTTTIFG